MIRKRNTQILGLLVLLVMYTFTPVAAQNIGNLVTKTHVFNAGDYIDEEFETGGTVDFLVFAVEGELNAGLFVGSNLPAEMRITHPEWVRSGTTFEIFCNARGLPEGRVGIDVHAGVKLTFSFLDGMIEIDAINVDRTLDLTLELTTPIGVSISESISGSVEIGSVILPLCITSLRVAAYLGVTASIELQGTLISEFRASSSALVSEIEEELYWDEENETITETLSVRASGTQNIESGFSNTRLRLDRYAITITSIFIELEALGYVLPRLVLPIPSGLLGSIVSGVSLTCENPTSSVIRVVGTNPQPINVPLVGISLGIGGILIALFLLSRK